MEFRSVKVAVIGAGMAGLVTARELISEGHQVTVFEKSDRVGGLWAYDPRIESPDLLGLDPDRERVHSSLYKSLRVNIPRQLMGFLDYPFVRKQGGDPRSFPSHEEVLGYLEDFARDFGLCGLVRFRDEVVRVERVGSACNQWVVAWKFCGNEEFGCETESEEIFEAVVLCNGKFSEPRIADFPGRETWPGVQIHSHNYRTPEPFKNQQVLVIGNGPSARDIIREICEVAKEVHQAWRPPSIELVKLIKSEIEWHQHPMIKCAQGDGKLIFEDGSSVYADVIIHCTGYNFYFPFLRTDGKVVVDDNRVGPLYKHVFPPSLAPWLSFVGLPTLVVPSIVSELQAKWVARVLSGKVTLPTEAEMMLSVEELYQHLEKTEVPKCHTHKLRQEKWEYEYWLIGQVGLPPLERWKDELSFSMLLKIISSHGHRYRDIWDVDSWIQNRVLSSE